MKRRILNLMISIDQTLFCIITLGHSDPDETFSAGAYRTEMKGKLLGKFFRPIIDALFWFDPDHCLQSYLKERKP